MHSAGAILSKIKCNNMEEHSIAHCRTFGTHKNIVLASSTLSKTLGVSICNEYVHLVFYNLALLQLKQPCRH